MSSPAVMGVQTDAGESRRSLLLSRLPKRLCLPEGRLDQVYSVKPSPSIGHRSVYERRVGDVDGVPFVNPFFPKHMFRCVPTNKLERTPLTHTVPLGPFQVKL